MDTEEANLLARRPDVDLFVSIDQATWFYGKPISRLLLILPSVSLSVLIPF
jgi:hypothetical protein